MSTTKPKPQRRSRQSLVHWREVQVLSPDIEPMSTARVVVDIETDEGSRPQAFTVRYRGNLNAAAVLETVRSFGFFPVSAGEVLS